MPFNFDGFLTFFLMISAALPAFWPLSLDSVG
jgi:hypothetical protein